jgi:hypothetical protein
MLTPLALALHEIRQLLSMARGKLSRAALHGKARSRQAGRVEAFEESETILETAVTAQQEADVLRTTWSVHGYIADLRHMGKGEPPERVVVPFEGEGGLRSLRDDRDADDGTASTPRPES